MNARMKQLTTAGILTAAAAGLGIYATMDPTGGGQRAGRLLAQRGCDVTITSPGGDPGGRMSLSAGQSLAVTLNGKAMRCPGGTVTVQAVVNGGAPSTLGTATVSATGLWSYGPTTLADQSTTVLTAGMVATVDDASRATSASLTVDANTARPRIVVTTPSVDGNGRARVVAPAADGGCGSGGNQHAEHGEPGYTHDLGCAAGGQVEPVVTVYGANPGTLTASFGITPLASVAITSDPQTFAADGGLGAWTLDDWTRDDLTFRAAKDGDAGTAEQVVDLQVATGVPPNVVFTVTTVHSRHQDFDIAITLPSAVAPVARPTIEAFWTKDYNRKSSTALVSRGVATITSTPALVADPPTAKRSAVVIGTIADAGTSVFCSDTVPPADAVDGGVRIRPSEQAAISQCGDGFNRCCPTTPVYCATASGTANVTVQEGNFCDDISADLLHDRAKADHRTSCWGDGSDGAVQLWRCEDGRQYRGGEVYVQQVRDWPGLFDYTHFTVEAIW